MNRVLTVAVGAVFGAALVSVAPAAQAEPGDPITLSITGGMGAYPRSSTQYTARTGEVVAEGTDIDAACWVQGDPVTNVYDYTSTVWVRDGAGSFWPEAWLETGSEGVPTGVPSCANLDQATAAPPWQPSCTPGGEYIDGPITVASTDRGARISLTPTEAARAAWAAGLGRESTVDMWHAVQNCVPGLYGEKADSVWQQLECHQRWATIPKPDGTYATGDTYDFETWADPLATPTDLGYVLTRCLGKDYDPQSGTDTFWAPLRLFAITE